MPTITSMADARAARPAHTASNAVGCTRASPGPALAHGSALPHRRQKARHGPRQHRAQNPRRRPQARSGRPSPARRWPRPHPQEARARRRQPRQAGRKAAADFRRDAGRLPRSHGGMWKHRYAIRRGQPVRQPRLAGPRQARGQRDRDGPCRRSPHGGKERGRGRERPPPSLPHRDGARLRRRARRPRPNSPTQPTRTPSTPCSKTRAWAGRPTSGVSISMSPRRVPQALGSCRRGPARRRRLGLLAADDRDRRPALRRPHRDQGGLFPRQGAVDRRCAQDEGRPALRHAAVAVALSVVERRIKATNGDRMFPCKGGGAMAYTSLATAPTKAGLDLGTPHSWRSMLADRLRDRRADHGAVELQLAHSLGKVRTAYRRGQAIDQRRRLWTLCGMADRRDRRERRRLTKGARP